VCSPGRNFVTLRLETADGVTGLGDATLNGRELAVASYLTDHVVPLLIGRDARRIEDIWQLLYKGAYWRRGPVTMTAIAAVDTALWDIKGKALGAPVYQLLGGASRDAVTSTATRAARRSTPRWNQPPPQSRTATRRYGCSAVFRASNVRTVSRAADHYEPAQRGPLSETVWNTEPYLAVVPQLFERLRRELGRKSRCCTTRIIG
jgi:mannonate dehydratase